MNQFCIVKFFNLYTPILRKLGEYGLDLINT